MARPNGTVVYHGPSMLDPSGPWIVAIVTGTVRPSDNPKTGPMLQLWILVADESPMAALDSGNDSANCGQCPLRGAACYVAKWQAPAGVWKCWQRGGYVEADTLPEVAAIAEGKAIRLGAYGDPMALPLPIVNALVSKCETHTGYTHQWDDHARGMLDEAEQRAWSALIMASCESLHDAEIAQSLGWRTFRIVSTNEQRERGEAVCPATLGDVKCIDCGLCNGTAGAAASIVIEAHGSGAGLIATA